MLRRALLSTACAAATRSRSFSARFPARLWDKVTVTEGRSWVCMVPTNVRQHPRARSQQLRWSGNARAAHHVLKQAGMDRSPDEADLIEFLLVLLNTDEFKGPRERLEAMVEMLWNARSRKPKPAYNIILTACAKESARVSDNSSVKVDVILKTAQTIWNEMMAAVNVVDPRNTALMYRICGNCKNLELARQIRDQVNDPVISRGEGERRRVSGWSSKDATAAYILCLGQCGRPTEAEQHYFSRENRSLMASDDVLSALFRAYVASNRMSKAEALIAMHGSNFLSVQSCNAFIRQCAVLRLLDSAIDFVHRMSRSDETGFPAPNAGTYNLLLRGISAGSGSEDREIAADRAMQIVEEMKREGIKPTTVTYNTLIRSFVFCNQIDEAFQLYNTMDSPNRITFSHLMQGAANAGNLELAEKVFSYLLKARERPNYGFCKSYLEVIAKREGTEAAFSEALRISEEFGDVVVFGDVASQEVVRMALIAACGKVGDLQKAFDALHLDLASHSKRVGRLAPLYVATVLMQVCLECDAPGRALEVFYSLKNAGLQPNFEVYESLIYGLCSLVRASTLHAEQKWAAQDAGEYGESDSFDETGFTERDVGFQASDGDDEDFHDAFGPKAERRGSNRLRHTNAFADRNWLDARLGCDDALRIAVELLREMHECGQARAMRQAAYVYNTLIAAAAAVGDFELALQVFNKMSKRNNHSVVYFSRADRGQLQVERDRGGVVPSNLAQGAAEEGEGAGASASGEQGGLAALVSTGMFESSFEFPEATVGTYNSMIDAAAKCGQAWFSFELFGVMQMDRNTEPNAATLNLLADIALVGSPDLPAESQQKLLQELDRKTFLPHEVCKKRVRLRQKLLALRWS